MSTFSSNQQWKVSANTVVGFIKIPIRFSNSVIFTMDFKAYYLPDFLISHPYFLLKVEKLQAFEMWCYRRMVRISWIDRTTDIMMLKWVGDWHTLIKAAQRRRDTLIDHILCHTEGRIDGKLCIRSAKKIVCPKWCSIQYLCWSEEVDHGHGQLEIHSVETVTLTKRLKIERYY